MYKVFLQHPEAAVPVTATTGSAGYDLSACVDDCVPAGQWKAIETGVVVQFPSDCYLRIAPRSGLAYKKGLDVFAGVIDSDYTGTIKVILMNHGAEDFEVKVGDRIAQMIYERIYKPTLQVVDSMEALTATARGAGGFGSTGVSTGGSTAAADTSIEAWGARQQAADKETYEDAVAAWRNCQLMDLSSSRDILTPNDEFFEMILNITRQKATDKVAADVQNDV